MKNILVIGEKTSQVKKFVNVLCGSYTTKKQAKYVYTYTGQWKTDKNQYNLTFLPLAGHITTIDTKNGYNWGECPPIKIVYDKDALVVKNQRKYVTILKNQIKEKDEVWLALDPDSEGDNIALEVINILDSYLNKHNIHIKRIWNSSLTEKEIRRAFNNPRQWNNKLALGVQGRRIIDAWLGFAGTREITRAARQVAKVKVLSVGRVQLPTLYLIVHQDFNHETFVPKNRWKLTATFQTLSKELFDGSHEHGYFKKKQQIQNIVEELEQETTATVTKIDRNTLRTTPPVPLNTTSAVSLLSKILKISADKSLKVMVDLYNKGLLSYPRTENKKFKDKFPHKKILSSLIKFEKYLPHIQTIKSSTQVRKNGPKKGEEDHDPIHPTGELKGINNLDKLQYKAWDILSRYYISLFMDDLIINQVLVKTKIKSHIFETEGRVISNQGWRKIQWWKKTKTNVIPTLEEGQKVHITNIQIETKKTKPPARMSDSNLMLEMEKANIGTKSSRPDIINKLKRRNYILRRKQKIISTTWGRALIASLTPIWPEIVTPMFTSHVENLMDQVAKGKRSYNEMINQLRNEYIELHKQLLPKLNEYKRLLQELNLSDQNKSSSSPDMINDLLATNFSKS